MQYKMLSYFLFKKKKLLLFSRIIFFFLLSEANNRAKHGKGLEILSPKQMLQGLPIALA